MISIQHLPVERLQEYFRTLTPQELALMLAEIERELLRGHRVPDAEFKLKELTCLLRAAGHRVRRIGNPARLFFGAVEPFLVDSESERTRRGYIARTSLAPIWAWIYRDLMQHDCKVYCDCASEALLNNDREKAERLARVFQDAARMRIQHMFGSLSDKKDAGERLAAYAAPPHVLDDLRKILFVLTIRDELAAFSSRLPARIDNLDDRQVDNFRGLLQLTFEPHAEEFLYALILVKGRLAVPWQLVRLATRAANRGAVPAVAEDPIVLAVIVVFAEIEDQVAALRNSLNNDQTATASDQLKGLHDTLNGLRTEATLVANSHWRAKIAAIEMEVSRAELEVSEGMLHAPLTSQDSLDFRRSL